jgi:hypothetical protein
MAGGSVARVPTHAEGNINIKLSEISLYFFNICKQQFWWGGHYVSLSPLNTIRRGKIKRKDTGQYEITLTLQSINK